jgi:hypothetical protein
MSTLHVAFGNSAEGSLREVVREAGRDDAVLAFPDDLSCGPIDSNEPSSRAAWWAQFVSVASDGETILKQFWDRIASSRDRLLAWFSRHSAPELSFFLAWADRLGERPYDILDITGRQLSLKRRDGTVVLRSLPSVSFMSGDTLQSLLGTERPITAEERDQCRRDWQRLRSENAPFRIVTQAGLVSAPVDYFDPLLLARAKPEWQSIAEIIHYSIFADAFEHYHQVRNVMLRARLAALVGEGRLIADGNPADRSTRIRLPS